MNTNLYPLLLSTSDIDGGAARAAYRLHRGLQHVHVHSQMLSFRKYSDDPFVHKMTSKLAFQRTKLSVWMDKHPLNLYPNRQRQPYWSLNWFPNTLAEQIQAFYPNLVHLHWIGNGFLPIAAMSRITRPILWTLHDMWAFTGGCHYSGTCTRYEDHCGKCPQLNSGQQYDLSWWTLLQKERHWQNLNLTVVTPSKWLAESARRSKLFRHCRVEVIPNGLDLEQYKPIDKNLARDLLNLPKDKKFILAGANEGLRDKRKGVQYLRPALQKVGAQGRDDVELVVFGSSKPTGQLDFGMPVRYLGHMSDDVSLALTYSAVDAFVAPSLQDNLPNTVMEALACGTPCVAFNIGGMPDMIDHCENGYLADPFDVDDLANGINWLLADDHRHKKIAEQARRKVVQHFELRAIAQRYADLYTELIKMSDEKMD